MPDHLQDGKADPEHTRLNGWKEIAEHLGNNFRKPLSVKTAQRWEEKEHLPVYRDGVLVFAWTDELDEWQAGRISRPATVPPADPTPFPENPGDPRPAPRKSLSRAVTLAAIVTALAGVSGWALLSYPRHREPMPSDWGRLLAGATSENTGPAWIPLDRDAQFLALTPDGKTLFAASHDSPIVLVILPAGGLIGQFALPSDARSMAMSADGERLYIGSGSDGVTILDVKDCRVIAQVPVPGEVLDLAITPDGKKLFLALGPQGFWRMRTSTREIKQISGLPCPHHVTVGGDQKLFVSYQCGGPTGRRGHDAVEIYDTDTEKPVGIVSGPPMIGGPLVASPDGGTLVLDGEDACQRPDYDHEGCSVIPSHVMHFLRLADRQITRSVFLPISTNLGRFLDDRHLLFVGERLIVIDAASRVQTERWEGWEQHDFPFRGVAIDSARRRAYVGILGRKQLLVLDSERSECSPIPKGLASFYSADGLLTDRISGDSLMAHGSVTFGPGRVGQAFVFDGGYLIGPSTSDNPFGDRDSSFVAYVKFAKLTGPMTLFDRAPGPSVEWHLMKDSDHRIVLDISSHGKTLRLASRTVVAPNRWYQLAVTKTDRGVTLYVNGILESNQAPSSSVASSNYALFYLGASHDQRQFLRGKLDEVLIYNRALTAQEVHDLYREREEGGCRI